MADPDPIVPPVVDPPPPAIDPPPSVEDPPLGPEGEKALQAWKDRAKAAEADAKRTKALEDELAALRAEQMTEQEKAIAAARQEAADGAKAEVLGTVNAKLFAAELKAAAKSDIATADGKHVRLTDPSLLADPEVALRLLGLGEIPVTESGDIDTEAISTAVAALVAAKPYLAASATPPAGAADQGTRTPPAPKDLDAQIAEAEGKGDWDTTRRLKLHKLAALPRP